MDLMIPSPTRAHLFPQLRTRGAPTKVARQAVHALDYEGPYRRQRGFHSVQQRPCDLGQLRVHLSVQARLQGALDLGYE